MPQLHVLQTETTNLRTDQLFSCSHFNDITYELRHCDHYLFHFLEHGYSQQPIGLSLNKLRESMPSFILPDKNSDFLPTKQLNLWTFFGSFLFAAYNQPLSQYNQCILNTHTYTHTCFIDLS